MRGRFILAAALVAATSAARADSCAPLVAGHAAPPAASRTRALGLLGSLTQMLSPLGRPVLASNLAVTVAINNDATSGQHAQAIADAQVTAANAYALADGLGATLATTYRAKATFTSADDGKTIRAGQVGPALAALFHAAEVTSGGDSAQAKYAFSNGHLLFGGGTYQPPLGGVLDVLGKAYGHPGGAAGAGCGDARPFMTAPLGAASGPSIHTFEGLDLFGVPTNSRILLEGVSADDAIGRTGSDLIDSPAFPSGHTTFAYTEALLLAMMVPERYAALAYRASEYGNSRIVLGAHYAVDVIGGRTLATYDLAQDLAGTPGYATLPGRSFRSALAAAAKELRGALRDRGCADIAACAAHDPVLRASEAAVLGPHGLQPAPTATAYAFRLNYGLLPLGPTDLPPDPVPVEAAALLETRFPYLTRAQRLDVLTSTEGPSGHFLAVDPVDGQPLVAGPPGPGAEAGAYSRLDLDAAAGGYRAFPQPVIVDQDPKSIHDEDLQSFAGFARDDTWSNDIAGPGGLTKRGSGTLTLAGADTYAGPTVVEGGTLAVAGSLRAPVEVRPGATLVLGGRVGDVSVAAGATLVPSRTPAAVSGTLDLAPGARLRLAAPAPAPGSAILTVHGGIKGTFAAVDPPALRGRLRYTREGVFLASDDAGAPAH